ncbi:MAG TPA: hypothetical protein VFV38_16380 [Ktedonobacteraceae bacterium]|nr:hypothetical protein [Ktedonobacteraceae bacterium]
MHHLFSLGHRVVTVLIVVAAARARACVSFLFLLSIRGWVLHSKLKRTGSTSSVGDVRHITHNEISGAGRTASGRLSLDASCADNAQAAGSLGTGLGLSLSRALTEQYGE